MQEPDHPSGSTSRTLGWVALGAGVVLGGVTAWLGVSALDAPAWVQIVAFGLATLWCLAIGFLALRWIWRKLTYRVGVRLSPLSDRIEVLE